MESVFSVNRVPYLISHHIHLNFSYSKVWYSLLLYCVLFTASSASTCEQLAFGCENGSDGASLSFDWTYSGPLERTHKINVDIHTQSTQASLKILAKLYLVSGIPGLAILYFSHAFPQLLFTTKNPTSRGWVMWDV